MEWTSIKEEKLGQKTLRKKVSGMICWLLNKTTWETMAPFNEIGKQLTKEKHVQLEFSLIILGLKSL